MAMSSTGTQNRNPRRGLMLPLCLLLVWLVGSWLCTGCDRSTPSAVGAQTDGCDTGSVHTSGCDTAAEDTVPNDTMSEDISSPTETGTETEASNPPVSGEGDTGASTTPSPADTDGDGLAPTTDGEDHFGTFIPADD